jgi:hypothetical protein
MTPAKMTPDEFLAARTNERTDLLNRITAMLEQDERICAAWLFGSLASGEDDALSDLDLWVVVEDAHLGPLICERDNYVARVDEPLLRLSVWGNAPPHGAYMLVHYPGLAGPQHVDWYWQPRAQAYIPDDMLVLFDRVGLPRNARALPIWNRNLYHPPLRLEKLGESGRRRAITQNITYFWAMAPIVGKSIARGYDSTVAFLLESMQWGLHEIRWLLDGTALPERDRAGEQERIDRASAAQQLAWLYETIAAAKALTPSMIQAGATVPTATVPHIDRFLGHIAALVRQQS